MKYFKPELFLAFNSENARTANQASQAWDAAVAAYDQYLKSIRKRLPAAALKLSKLYLHDSEYLDFGEDSPSSENRVAHLTIRREGQTLLLLYFLLEPPLVTEPITDHVFSEQAVHWLYDELELVSSTDISHEILFSNGRIYRFRFHHLAILTIAAESDHTDVQAQERRSLPPAQRRRKAATA
jgi:hypothetical protein